jgi:predicted RNase H-like HicB family nuclease
MAAIHAKLKVIVHKAEEGGYWASVPALPGCYSQGETLAELRRNVQAAVDLYLDEAAGPAKAKKVAGPRRATLPKTAGKRVAVRRAAHAPTKKP